MRSWSLLTYALLLGALSGDRPEVKEHSCGNISSANASSVVWDFFGLKLFLAERAVLKEKKKTEEWKDLTAPQIILEKTLRVLEIEMLTDLGPLIVLKQNLENWRHAEESGAGSGNSASIIELHNEVFKKQVEFTVMYPKFIGVGREILDLSQDDAPTNPVLTRDVIEENFKGGMNINQSYTNLLQTDDEIPTADEIDIEFKLLTFEECEIMLTDLKKEIASLNTELGALNRLEPCSEESQATAH